MNRASQDNNGQLPSALSYKNEIIQSFQVFDNERTGSISINDLKLILRALGFRATKQFVLRDVMESHRRRGLLTPAAVMTESTNSFKTNDDEDNMFGIIKDIDLETVLDVILNPDSKYNRNNQTENDVKLMHKINFRLFDVENKGYITASNLKRVIQEVREFSSKEISKGGSPLSPQHNKLLNDIDDNELRAMIEVFDGDQDGMISEEEFRRIMENKY